MKTEYDGIHNLTKVLFQFRELHKCLNVTTYQLYCIWLTLKYRKKIKLVGFYGIWSLVGYFIPNPLYTYILNIYDLVWFCLVGFYGTSTIVGYFMPNPLYTYILNIYDLIWFGFMAHQPLQVILCQILFIHIY